MENTEVLDQPLSKEEKKQAKKAKRYEKKKKRYIFDHDIKYRGPLSYRYLRLIAWISVAVAQVVVMNSISAKLLAEPLIPSDVVEYGLEFFTPLSVPLFMIATFSTILNGNKSHKNVLIFYGAAYLGMAGAIIFAYYRYAAGIFRAIGEVTPDEFVSKLGSKFEINVFADLLMMSLFNFFISYKPKKYFQEESIYIFRSFALFPLLVAAMAYVMRIYVDFGKITVPFAIYPLLPTKPPSIYLLFILIVFWMKRRERNFRKFGGKEEDYPAFLNSNRTSLKFSIYVSVVMFIISVIDIVAVIILLENLQLGWIMLLSLGQSAGLMFAIPFMMLFSFTRKYDDSLDLIVVLFGVGLIALTYVEMGYRIYYAIMQNGLSL